jgi:hypothetical protein
MKLLALVKGPASIARYLAAAGEAAEVPRRSPGRGPPLSSTDRRNSLAEHFGWFHPIQGLSRAVVELPGDGVQVGGTVQAQVSFAWEVLAEEAVGVFVASALPWAVRVAEVDLHVGVRGEAYVISHLFPLIPGQRPAQLGRQLGNLAR